MMDPSDEALLDEFNSNYDVNLEETVPLLVPTNTHRSNISTLQKNMQKEMMKDVFKTINQRKLPEPPTDGESSSDEMYDYPSIEEIGERFKQFRKKTTYQSFDDMNSLETNYNPPEPSAPPMSVLQENNEDLTEVNLDDIADKPNDEEKHQENIESKDAQLVAQFHELIQPEANVAPYQLYDGITTTGMVDKGYTYNDVNLLPSAFINFEKHEMNLETQFSRRIRIKLPIVSSPMDTVTEEDMAIKLGLLGGIGVVHCNNTPEQQAAMIKCVKRYTNGFLVNPVVFGPTDSIQKVLDIKRSYSFSSFPVTQYGNRNDVLLGLLTKKDIPYAELLAKEKGLSLNQITVAQVMRQVSNLVTNDDFDIETLRKKMIEYRVSKIPIIQHGKLVALVCKTDFDKIVDHPNASIHPETKQLLVAAAISTGPGYQHRVKLLAEAKVDAIVIDSSQGCSKFQLECLLYIKEYYPEIDVVCGNVATKFQTKLLAVAGADAIRVGMGAGSICTTQGVTGVGRAQFSSVIAAVEAIKSLSTKSTPTSYCAGYTTTAATQIYVEKIPIIADGGIKSSGDIVKALAIGANTVMLGSLIAGTNETPGIIEERPNGYKVKKYRGMGSVAAMQKRQSDRYISGGKIIPQGVSGEVVAKGPLEEHLDQIIGGVKSGLMNAGIQTLSDIPEMNTKLRIRWEPKTHSAFIEGNVHSLHHYQY